MAISKRSLKRCAWLIAGDKLYEDYHDLEWKTHKDLPAVTPEAEALAKDLKKRGFKFLGPTVIYAHMQATGMVNDHWVECFRYKEV